MALPTDIIRFFATLTTSGTVGKARTISDFLKSINDYSNMMGIYAICKQLELKNILVYVGNPSGNPILGESYLSINHKKEFADYGAYDFLVYGFLSIKKHFENCVRPIIVTKSDGSLDIGTCFAIGDNRLLTARHCINAKSNVKIVTHNGTLIQAKKVIFSVDANKDIASIECAEAYFSDTPTFIRGTADVLDEVLTMGYPPIPGFDAPLVADHATISSTLKVSAGRITAMDTSYLDSQEYFLLNARVKGGNSGGPVINDVGALVGMIVHISADSENASELDKLGYGISVTSNDLANFIRSIESSSSDVEEIVVTNGSDGFTTLK